jgi:hypothetical protein
MSALPLASARNLRIRTGKPSWVVAEGKVPSQVGSAGLRDVLPASGPTQNRSIDPLDERRRVCRSPLVSRLLPRRWAGKCHQRLGPTADAARRPALIIAPRDDIPHPAPVPREAMQ